MSQDQRQHQSGSGWSSGQSQNQQFGQRMLPPYHAQSSYGSQQQAAQWYSPITYTPPFYPTIPPIPYNIASGQPYSGLSQQMLLPPQTFGTGQAALPPAQFTVPQQIYFAPPNFQNMVWQYQPHYTDPQYSQPSNFVTPGYPQVEPAYDASGHQYYDAGAIQPSSHPYLNPQLRPLVIERHNYNELIELEGFHRRRVITVRRFFWLNMKDMQICAQISGAYEVDGISGERLFNNFRTYFVSENYFEKLQEKSPNFRQFCVYIPSLLYISKIENHDQSRIYENYTVGEICKTFKLSIAKHLGGHLFMSRNGGIAYIPMRNDYMGIDQFGNHEWTYRYDTLTSIHAIYPVNRYEWQNDTQIEMKFVVGLAFKAYDNSGDRYYHRFKDDCQRRGVYELGPDLETATNHENESEENSLYLFTLFEENYSFTLFVCCGAKLCVIDPFNSERGHNRSFIQQGGVVSSDTKFHFEISHELKINQHQYQRIALDWHEFVDLVRKPVNFTDQKNLTDEQAQNWRDIKNPVLFLGANYSRYNSICWTLDVHRNSARLIVPEGGRIVAVAERDEEGLQEVRDRIYYEMLHESVVTEHGTEFRAPETKASIERILNFGDQRSFNCVLDNFIVEDPYSGQLVPTICMYKGQVGQQFFSEFAEHNFMSWKDLQLEESDFLAVYQNSPPTMPPMYPPYVETNVYLNTYYDTTYYLPNEKTTDFSMSESLKNFYRYLQCNWTNPTHNSYHLRDNTECNLKAEIFYQEYQWTRMTEIDPQDLNYLRDGKDFRVGIDGWIWGKGEFDEESKIEYDSLYYYNVYLPRPPR